MPSQKAPRLLLLLACTFLPALDQATAQVTWTRQVSPVNALLFDVAHGIDDSSGARQFVAVGGNSSLMTLLTSPDGVTWTRQNPPPTVGGFLKGVCHNGSLWVAVGADNGNVITSTSPDGVNWTGHLTGFGGTLNDVLWRGGEFIAVGSTGSFVGTGGSPGVIARSPDGVNWTFDTLSVATDLRGIVSAGSTILATGSQGEIFVSDQGGPFLRHSQSSNIGSDLNAVTFRSSPTAGDLFLTVGGGGLVMRSVDGGANFSSVPSGTSDHLQAVANAGDLIIAVGTQGRTIWSEDNGLTWSLETSITDYRLNGLTFGVLANGDGRFVAVGEGGTIITTDAAPATGGAGNLAIREPASTVYTYTGSATKSIQLIASGGPVTASISSSQPWLTANLAQVTVQPGTPQSITISALENTEPAPRTGTISIFHNGTTDLDFTQSGGPPSMPIVLPLGTVLTSESIRLQWADPDHPVLGYLVQRFMGYGSPTGAEVWREEATLGPDDREFTIGGLSPWTEYRLRLIAFNSNGSSAPAELLERTSVAAPSDFAATARHWSLVELTWSEVRGASYYHLERRIGATGNWRTLADFGKDINYHLDPGLPADTDIYYRLVARAEASSPVPERAASPDRLVHTPAYGGQVFWDPDPEVAQLELPAQEVLTAVAFGNGRHVAVGGNGEIVSSPDGLSWSGEPSGTSAGLQDVAFGNGLFVAVGDDGTIVTSPGDGIWASRSSGTTNRLIKVAFGAGTFVAGAYNPATFQAAPVLVSNDGVTWTAGTQSFFPRSASYGNGEFLITHGAGNIHASPDGTTWSQARDGGNDNSKIRTAAVWNGSLWVAVGAGGGFSTSTDGRTWTDGTIAGSPFLLSVTSGGGRFVAAGQDGRGGVLFSSTDGANWTEVAVFTTDEWLYDVTYASGAFVAVGHGGFVTRSLDGITWNQSRPSVPPRGGSTWLRSLAYGGGALVVGGETGRLFRRDPVTRVWSEQSPLVAGVRILGVSYANGNFFVCPQVNDRIYQSPDGLNWTSRSLPGPAAGGYHRVGYGNGLLVAGGSQDILHSSDNGLNWSIGVAQGQLGSININNILFDNGRWFTTGIGSNYGLLRSSDGTNWSFPGADGVEDATPTQLFSIAAGRVNGVRTYLTDSTISVDGQYWNSIAAAGYRVAYGDGVFVRANGIGASALQASVDGVNWEDPPPGFLPDIDGYSEIAYDGNGEFSAVGQKLEVHTFRVSASPLTRGDVDGISDAIENAAPNSGDGNNDGTPDAQQAHVTSLPAPGGHYLTLVTPLATPLANVGLIANPSPSTLPSGVSFPLGLLSFSITNLTPGAASTVEIHYPPSVSVNAYYKHGPTPADPSPHWYRFDYDPLTNTGAVITPGRIVLYFVDGLRGDDDLTANGQITDDGGPAFVIGMQDPNPWSSKQLAVGASPEGFVEIAAQTNPGTVYTLQMSEDLQTFRNAAAVQATTEETIFIDGEIPLQPRRFYRVVGGPLVLDGMDVGTPGIDPREPGSHLQLAAGDYDVTAGGSDIWNQMDGFYFLHTPFIGDFDLAVRVDALQYRANPTKAGLMARASLAPGARNVTAMIAHPAGFNRYEMTARTVEDDWTFIQGTDFGVSFPAWVRMTRSGQVFRAYRSADGMNWVQYSSITMPADFPIYAQVGLAACPVNNNPGQTTSVEFRQLRALP